MSYRCRLNKTIKMNKTQPNDKNANQNVNQWMNKSKAIKREGNTIDWKKRTNKSRPIDIENERHAVESLFFPPETNHIVNMPPALDTNTVSKPFAPPPIGESRAETTNSSSVECNKSKANHLKAIAYDGRNECYQNYKGTCKIACGLTHIFRPPKQLIVCDIYAETGRCPNERRCRFMHSDYPCKYYYLGVPHPNSEAKCLYSHGEPLDSEVIHAVLAEAQRSRILGPNSTYESVEFRFESRNDELKRKYGFPATTGASNYRPRSPARECTAADANTTDTQSNPNNPNPVEKSKFHAILTEQQIQALAAINVESLEQLITLSVAEQRALGLNVEQIFQLHLAAVSVNAFEKVLPREDPPSQNAREDTSDQTIVNPLHVESESSISTEQKTTNEKNMCGPCESSDGHQSFEEDTSHADVQCAPVNPCDSVLPADFSSDDETALVIDE